MAASSAISPFQAKFANIPPTPKPRGEQPFRVLLCNEEHSDTVLSQLPKYPGSTVVATSTLHALNLALATEAEQLVIIDLSTRVNQFWQQLLLIIQDTTLGPTDLDITDRVKREVIQLFIDNEEAYGARLAPPIGDLQDVPVFIDRILKDLFEGKVKVTDLAEETIFHIYKFIVDFTKNPHSWVGTPKNFEKIRKMVLQGRVVVLQNNLFDPNEINPIAHALKGDKVKTIYISNIPEYVDRTKPKKDRIALNASVSMIAADHFPITLVTTEPRETVAQRLTQRSYLVQNTKELLDLLNQQKLSII